MEKIEYQNEREFLQLAPDTRAAAQNIQNFYAQFTVDAINYIDNTSSVIGDNVITSPISAAFALSMVANGLNDEDAKVIYDYLGCQDIESINDLSKTILSELPKADNQTNLKFANSAWINNSYKLSQGYSSILDSYYSAQISYEDFRNNSQKTLKSINNWCSSNTNGLIPSIIDEIDGSKLFVLLNALYFNGKWEEDTFESKDTKKDVFYGVDGISKIDMMYTPYSNRRYSFSDHFQSVFLQFGNQTFSLMLVLPDEGVSINEAKSYLVDEFSQLISTIGCLVEVYMPKFKIQNKLNLNEVFANTPLSSILKPIELSMFEPKQNGLIKFNQGASMELDEKGAVVAAVTSTEAVSSAPEVKPMSKVKVKFNRPFFFFLRDNNTGACLLSGRIANL